jgi:hypothetical protein
MEEESGVGGVRRIPVVSQYEAVPDADGEPVEPDEDRYWSQVYWMAAEPEVLSVLEKPDGTPKLVVRPSQQKIASHISPGFVAVREG